MCACVICGQPTKVFERSGKAKRFCGKKCMAKAGAQKRRKRPDWEPIDRVCPACSKPFFGRAVCCCKKCRDVLRMRTRRIDEVCKCKQCGIEFRPRAEDRKAYCSRECAFESRRERAGEARRAEEVARRLQSWRACEVCSCVFMARRKNHCVCSRECQLAKGRAYSKEHKTHMPDVVQCDRCNTDVIRKVGDEWITKGSRCNECRKTARRAQHKRTLARRELLKRGHPIRTIETIIDEDVFCSQLWMCRICGERVDHRVKAPNHLAAEMDHVVPLSKGGMHTRDNVQCTHRICNNAKSDGTQDEARRGIAFVKWMMGKTVNQLCHCG